MLTPGDGPISLDFSNDLESPTGEFLGCLIHHAPSVDIDAVWLGVGVCDCPTELKDLMVVGKSGNRQDGRVQL